MDTSVVVVTATGSASVVTLEPSTLTVVARKTPSAFPDPIVIKVFNFPQRQSLD